LHTHATAVQHIIETAAGRSSVDLGHVFSQGAHRAELFDVYSLAVKCGVASGLFGLATSLCENLIGIQS
jgi:hypothetical protein